MPKLRLVPRPAPERANGARSFSYALQRGALVLGVGGAVEVRPGVWQLWSKPGPMTRAAWGYALSVIRDVMTVLSRHQGAVRFELYVVPDRPGSVRLARRLGFVRVRADEHLDLFAKDA